jgi:hypothetical protein
MKTALLGVLGFIAAIFAFITFMALLFAYMDWPGNFYI